MPAIVRGCAAGLLAGCVVLAGVAVSVTPGPTVGELAEEERGAAAPSGHGHEWRRAPDGTRLYERVYSAAGPRRGAVLYVAGITGLGRDGLPEFAAELTGRGFDVRIPHPRGTGYSGGPRGDIADLDRYLEDYLVRARAMAGAGTPTVIVGHSLGGAFALRVAAGMPHAAGLVLVNPAHRFAASPASAPTLLQYVAFGTWMVVAPGRRVVDMGGRPEAIQHPGDRAEARRRRADPLVVRWFSLRAMVAAKRVMDGAPADAARCRSPLLLVDGDADQVVDRAGHAALLAAYGSADRTRVTIAGGGHGYETMREAMPTIAGWMEARLR